MPKRKKRKTHKKSNKLSKLTINSMLGIVIVIILAFLVNLYISNQKLKEQQLQKIKIEKKQLLKKQQLLEEKKLQEKQAKYFEEKTKAMSIDYTSETVKVVKPKIIENEQSMFKYIAEELTKKQPLVKLEESKKKEDIYTIKEQEPTIEPKSKSKPKDIEPKVTTILPLEVPKIIKDLPGQHKPKKKRKIPKIAIIIDDITAAHQIKAIKKIPYPVTMAFLPPTSRHKNSANIAKNIPVHMIHLPLEAKTRRYEEENTLYVGDEISLIDKRIKILKSLYPKAKYINNHTGSRFTSNKDSMDKLLKILKKYDYIFVDSRTCVKTETAYYAKKHNLRYLSRNIFLDNKREKRYIQKQLQKAVKIARRDGFAIAIGHPHSITLKTLAQSKYLLKGLEIVLIDKL